MADENNIDLSEFQADGEKFFAENKSHFDRTFGPNAQATPPALPPTAKANEVADFLDAHVYKNSPYQFELVPAAFSDKIVRLIIGRGGCHFYRITENSGVDYIWYDNDTQNIMVVGKSVHDIHMARTMLNLHIQFTLKQNASYSCY